VQSRFAVLGIALSKEDFVLVIITSCRSRLIYIPALDNPARILVRDGSHQGAKSNRRIGHSALSLFSRARNIRTSNFQLVMPG
jgi:hypothetical protein